MTKQAYYKHVDTFMKALILECFVVEFIQEECPFIDIGPEQARREPSFPSLCFVMLWWSTFRVNNDK